MSELIILMGLQGSGKSTFYRTHFARTHTLVSKDLFPNNRNKARRQQQLLREAFERGEAVVLDNTNPSVADRIDAIALAQTHQLPVFGYVFVCTVAEAKIRNAQREGKARIPDVAIYTTASKWEPPTLAEGFNRLFQVRPKQDNKFDILSDNEEERI